MARAPSRAGKTRLASQIAEPRLRALREALLADTLRLVSNLPDADPFLFFTPEEAEPEIRVFVKDPVKAVCQHGADLGERMRSALEDLIARRRYAAALLVGADTPFLSEAHISSAREMLRSAAGVVLGPADDGGYYLIGMTEVHAGLFDGIEWGTRSVLKNTLCAADRLGIEARLIRSTYDIDTSEDLQRLERDLAGSAPDVAVSVRRWLLQCDAPNHIGNI